MRRAVAAAIAFGIAAAPAARAAPFRIEEATLADLQAELAAGRLTSVQLVQHYVNRILQLDQGASGVNAVVELNPDALALARQADAQRRAGRAAGPLHGIPFVLKDNIDTGDRMQTTAGSLGLVGAPPLRDSTVAAKLRAAGAIILGKTNLSEWANFRSFFSTSGWSGRGGLTHNAYSLDRNACGSSSGSAAAVTANFAAAGLGTETDGSIVCPANVSGVVGVKPTVGLVSRAGVVPISHVQDTVGPHARTVADAARLLDVIVSRTPDPRDPATAGVPLGWSGTGRTRPALPRTYTAFLDPDGLRGAVLGVTRQGIDSAPPQVVAAFDDALAAIQGAGATLVDLDGAKFVFPPADGELLVLLFDFRRDVEAYFATRAGVPLAGKALADAIAFNTANAAAEMPYFGQELFELANALEQGEDTAQPIFGMTYDEALAIDAAAGANGIDAALASFGLDAIVAPTDSPAWTTDLVLSDHFIFASSGLAGPAGYPIVQVPAASVLGLPQGVSFLGTAFSEPTLLRLASGFEAVTHARFEPTFTGNVTSAATDGTTLVRPKKSGQRAPGRPHRL
ncbi:MAG TPA: amidase [Anaeromyxobacteraceae bacterium]|nr:amidase [Anaeromyxobacteraceae bacterium]